MKLSPEITLRHLPHSDALEADIREKIDKLDQIFGHIMSCRVVVEPAHQHSHKGNLYHVRVALTVPPRQELVAGRDPGKHQAHEDVYVAVRDAFNAIQRQLEDYARKLRRDIKTHETADHGHIMELMPSRDYGRIRTADGREVYFHRNSVVSADFDKLKTGVDVRFVEEQGENGPQASTVQVVGKHHIVG